MTKPSLAKEIVATKTTNEGTKTIEAMEPKTDAEVPMKSEMKSSEDITDDGKCESSYNAHDFEKKEKLARTATELLLHLYNSDKPRRQNQTRFVYSKGEDSGSDNELLDDEIVECESLKIFCHKRKSNYSRAKRERVPPKEKMFQEFCRRHETPGDIILEKGTRRSVRVKSDRCAKQISKNLNRKDHNERRKFNIEKKLKKWGIKRNGVPVPGYKPLNENPREKYQLHQDNAPNEMQDMLTFLMALQDRDVTPEDYEFLLKLDDLVPKKTVSNRCLQRLREELVDESHGDEICGICMDDYKIGETRKRLPCEHVFHKHCIEQWLSQSSTKCPLDGLEL